MEQEARVKRYGDLAGDGGSGIAAQVEAAGQRLAARLAAVGSVVAVMSGKGGVGKSVVTANVAAALAASGARVGVVDADINGPSLPLLLGARGRGLVRGPDGLVPAVAPCGVRLVSTDLLVGADGAPVVWKTPTQADSFVWRGAAEASALREFLGGTEWGELDWLFIDLPPGADRVETVLGLLPERAGYVAVAIPSAVAVLSVRRAVALAAGAGRRPLGLIENMAAGSSDEGGAGVAGAAGAAAAAVAAVAADARGDAVKDSAVAGLARTGGLALLGRIPFDPVVAACADAGTPAVLARPEAPGARALAALAARLCATAGRRA